MRFPGYFIFVFHNSYACTACMTYVVYVNIFFYGCPIGYSGGKIEVECHSYPQFTTIVLFRLNINVTVKRGMF